MVPGSAEAPPRIFGDIANEALERSEAPEAPGIWMAYPLGLLAARTDRPRQSGTLPTQECCAPTEIGAVSRLTRSITSRPLAPSAAERQREYRRRLALGLTVYSIELS